jgi:hypothetical protein
MCRVFISCLVANALAVASVAQAAGSAVCRPKLTFTDVQFSEMIPPTLERKWTAVVAVDASRCMTSSGKFAIGFARLKENAPEVDFRVPFTWRPTRVEVAVDFWGDEAVQGYWLDNIAACPCQN